MDSQTILQQAMDETNGIVFGVWFLIGAALVFFMQAGFAMVETGFTRAKNAGNHHEELNGLLYRYSSFHSHRLRSSLW